MFIYVLTTLILFTGYTTLIIYYSFAWKTAQVFRLTDSKSLNPCVNISVIIPVRNEELTIGECIRSISLQTYPAHLFEVIIIDDFSTDQTWEIISKLPQNKFPITSIRLSDFPPAETANGFKKLAITKGIDASTGSLIVTTDADCTFDKNWLLTLATFYQESGAKFIAAPVKIASGNSFLDVFQTLDFITLQGITAASVTKKIHSMCNGANLAYEKKIFYEVGGFRGIDQIPSGDDMLLMHKIYTQYPENVFFLKCKTAIVSTKAEKTWSGFMNQRIRWASKTSHYDDKRIFWTLILVYLANVLLLSLLFAAIGNTFFLLAFVILLVAKTCIEFPFVSSAARFFGQGQMMRYFPFLQPFHVIYTVFIGFLGKTGKYQWKGRVVKK